MPELFTYHVLSDKVHGQIQLVLPEFPYIVAFSVPLEAFCHMKRNKC